ncbi:MAG: DUF3450 family protein [Desulfovibrio sp.]
MPCSRILLPCFASPDQIRAIALAVALLSLVLLLCPGSAARAAPPATPNASLPQAAGELSHSLEQARAAQAATDAEARELQKLLAEQQTQRQYLLWLEHQNNKYEKYIQQREHAVELLEQRRQEAGTIRLALEPALDDLARNLEEAVQQDLPFLPEERAERLKSLRAVLDDYNAPLGEKLRRTLEVLLVEARYGSEVAAEQAVIRPGPEQGQLQGRTLRLGRLAQYFLSRNGERGFVLERGTSPTAPVWRELPADAAGTLARALDMADRAAPAMPLALPAPETLPLPIPAQAQQAPIPPVQGASHAGGDS